IIATIFPKGGRHKEVASWSLRRFADEVEARSAAKRKSALPLISLATYGGRATKDGNLLTAANLESVHGVEADYDGGWITPRQARARLEKAGLAGLISTSPSHEPDAPRWRVLCPLANEVEKDDRAAMVARLQGVFGGKLGP